MEFENITYAPIDLDAIAPDLLSAREKKDVKRLSQDGI